MASLNTRVIQKPIYTAEGGKAAHITPEQQLRRTVLSCMLWENIAYESGQTVAQRIAELVAKVKPHRVCGLAIAAREQYNLRHVPLLIVREMARLPEHKKWVATTLAKVIQRPDEITEFLKIYWATQGTKGKKTLSAQVKRGLNFAFQKFSEHALAKYDRENEVKLRDALFLSHAKPKDIPSDKRPYNKRERAMSYGRDMTPNELLYQKITNRTLTTPETWEVQLSAGADKKQTFEQLMSENKLGAMAFLRNLRNMSEAGCSKELVERYAGTVKLDRVLPYRFIAAATAVPHWEPLIEKMFLRKCANLTKLSGKTVILIDVSISMDSKLSDKSNMSYLDAACALAMIGREMFDEIGICTFSGTFANVAPRHGFALRDAIKASQPRSNTFLAKAVAHLNANSDYDRLIVITDEQSHDGIVPPKPGSKGYLMNVASHKNGVGYGEWVHLDGFSSALWEFLVELEHIYTPPIQAIVGMSDYDRVRLG